MLDNKTLMIVRQQLKLAVAFLQACDDVWRDGRIWYAGYMPAYPNEYEPNDWQQAQEPIYHVWERALDHLASDSPDAAKVGHALPIADLLAASKEAEAQLS